jgi:hypothetical protein
MKMLWEGDSLPRSPLSSGPEVTRRKSSGHNSAQNNQSLPKIGIVHHTSTAYQGCQKTKIIKNIFVFILTVLNSEFPSSNLCYTQFYGESTV